MAEKMRVELRSGVERWREDLEKAEQPTRRLAAKDVAKGKLIESGEFQEALKSDGRVQFKVGATRGEGSGGGSRRGGLDLGYRPFRKQQEFHKSRAKYRLFGGAAGPGKSKALLMEAILQAHDHARVNTLLLRRTFPELEASLLLYFRRDVPRELYKAYNDSKHVVTWWNGSTTRFGYCKSENDIYQYQGAEFLFIGIDELTLFTLKQWQFLTSRNRCPVAGCFPNMAGATNPGNIGHAWVKALWVDKQAAPGMDSAEEYDPADYDFISAKVWDNPIYASDKNYVKTLQKLPSALRRAFLDGDWNVFAGQYFDLFDPGRHVERAENLGMESWWPRWISIDWGFEHPAAVYWHAAGPRRVVEEEPKQVETAGVAPSENSGEGNSIVEEKNPTSIGEEACASSARLSGAPPSPQTAWARKSGVWGTQTQSKTTQNAEHFASHMQEQHVGHPQHNRSHADVAASRKALTESTLGQEQVQNASSSEATVVDAREKRLGAGDARRAAGKMSRVVTQTTKRKMRVVTYRELVRQRLGPRALAQAIVELSEVAAVGAWGGSDAGAGAAGVKFGEREAEKIDAIYLSPDAFARRTDEATIADQMGDIFAACGLPRPSVADNDRIGGWMLMYQMLAEGEWTIAGNCTELIRVLPTMVRDTARIEDIEKFDGDDAADAARYGLKSRSLARQVAHPPLEMRLAEKVSSADPTIRAIQAKKANLEERGRGGPVFFSRRRK